jgi:hypothetical protein
MSVETLQIDPASTVPDSVSGIIDEMNSEGLDTLMADWPEMQTIDMGLDVARFGSGSSNPDRLSVVVTNPFGNQLLEHRMVLADMQHRQLVAATNGEQEIDLITVASPGGKAEIIFNETPQHERFPDVRRHDSTFLSSFGREILYSLHRGGHISGRVVLAGPSLAGALSLATGSDKQVRRSFDVEAIGDYLDPRVKSRSMSRLGWQFLTSGGQFGEDVEQGGLEPYKEALELHTQLEFVRGILQQLHLNKQLARDLARPDVINDLSRLSSPDVGVPVSGAHVVLAAGTHDEVAPYAELASTVEFAEEIYSRARLGRGSTTLIEVTGRGHTALDNPAVYAEIFERTMQPVIAQEL